MPEITLKPSDRKFYLCSGRVVAYPDLHEHADSHILGELRHLTDEGRRVSSLALYLTPASCSQVPPINPVIVAYVIGDARLITCRYADCDSRPQRWELGKAGFLALMERYEARHEKHADGNPDATAKTPAWDEADADNPHRYQAGKYQVKDEFGNDLPHRDDQGKSVV